ncbi:ABC-2 type transport system permease protein [Quadrisphaera granulorum]|uniref:ABC-2 type transport system permease protein n=1 Tax=Quadrisphaera granulorum TaxID=317664 RepID=A0A316AZ39_9ACTN|nr:hypothetical protein [Quadrisphaera granulorum]PWJ55497.1 ABC-2 type transport system permease protein [Quadrisphaera granulorum]SZE95561.1 ABC-2 type transport system permease protein [Quadrisphaera granulorum]
MSPLAALSAAVRLEVVRLATVRSSAVLLALAAAAGAAGAAALCALAERADIGRSGLLEAVTGGSASGLSVVGIAAALAGALVAAGDARHGAERTALVLVPRRGALLTARTVVVAGWSAALAVASLLAAVAVVVLWPQQQLVAASPGPVVLAAPLLGYVGLVVLHGVAGLALTALLRSAVAAVSLVVAWPLVLEPLLGSVLPPSRWGAVLEGLLPAAAASRLVAAPPVAAGTPWLVGSAVAGGALLAAVSALVLLAAVRGARRDA